AHHDGRAGAARRPVPGVISPPGDLVIPRCGFRRLRSQKQVNAVDTMVKPAGTGAASVVGAARLTANIPDPTCTNWTGGWSPPPARGVDATVVGTHVFTLVWTGMIIGAEAGPTVRKDGRTATMVPFCEQMVTCTDAGTSIGAA